MMDPITRRHLIQRSLATGAALSLPFVGTTSAWGAKAKKEAKITPAESNGVVGANDDVRIAVVGFNGRGKSHIDAWRKIKGVRLVALCYADEAVLNKMADQLGKSVGTPASRPSTKPTAARSAEGDGEKIVGVGPKASVEAPVTTTRPTRRSASRCSRSESSNASNQLLATSGSSSRRGVSSSAYSQAVLPRGIWSSKCWTQTTGTPSRRALSTRLPTFATTASRS